MVCVWAISVRKLIYGSVNVLYKGLPIWHLMRNRYLAKQTDYMWGYFIFSSHLYPNQIVSIYKTKYLITWKYIRNKHILIQNLTKISAEYVRSVHFCLVGQETSNLRDRTCKLSVRRPLPCKGVILIRERPGGP